MGVLCQRGGGTATTTRSISALDRVLLARAARAIREIEPSARVILYGSRARGDAREDSDWDILVLVDGAVDLPRTTAIRQRLYEIEWETGDVLCAIVRGKQEWDTPRYRAMEFHANVERDGLDG